MLAVAPASPQKIREKNPVKNDPILKALLEDLDSIEKGREFRRWRASFLARFETFIEQKGVEPASQAYQKFYNDMSRFYGAVMQLAKFVENGSISQDKVSVKGRNGLNEANRAMTDVVDELLSFIPTSGAEVKQCGYNKWQLGVVLIRDGFQVYEKMVVSGEILVSLKEKVLTGIADKQILEQIDYYVKQVACFCDVMADLGLYEVMLKCREFNGDDDILIFIDPKTGAIGELCRKSCKDAGLITITTNAFGKEAIKEAASGVDKQALVQTIKEKVKFA